MLRPPPTPPPRRTPPPPLPPERERRPRRLGDAPSHPRRQRRPSWSVRCSRRAARRSDSCAGQADRRGSRHSPAPYRPAQVWLHRSISRSIWLRFHFRLLLRLRLRLSLKLSYRIPLRLPLKLSCRNLPTRLSCLTFQPHPALCQLIGRWLPLCRHLISPDQRMLLMRKPGVRPLAP